MKWLNRHGVTLAKAFVSTTLAARCSPNAWVIPAFSCKVRTAINDMAGIQRRFAKYRRDAIWRFSIIKNLPHYYHNRCHKDSKQSINWHVCAPFECPLWRDGAPSTGSLPFFFFFFHSFGLSRIINGCFVSAQTTNSDLDSVLDWTTLERTAPMVGSCANTNGIATSTVQFYVLSKLRSSGTFFSLRNPMLTIETQPNKTSSTVWKIGWFFFN